ncbi:hypothetical protein V1478_016032, partial [Vespula squamosa]
RLNAAVSRLWHRVERGTTSRASSRENRGAVRVRDFDQGVYIKGTRRRRGEINGERTAEINLHTVARDSTASEPIHAGIVIKLRFSVTGAPAVTKLQVMPRVTQRSVAPPLVHDHYHRHSSPLHRPAPSRVLGRAIRRKSMPVLCSVPFCKSISRRCYASDCVKSAVSSYDRSGVRVASKCKTSYDTCQMSTIANVRYQIPELGFSLSTLLYTTSTTTSNAVSMRIESSLRCRSGIRLDERWR